MQWDRKVPIGGKKSPIYDTVEARKLALKLKLLVSFFLCYFLLVQQPLSIFLEKASSVLNLDVM